MIWGYVVGGVVCFIVGAMCVWVFPHRKRVRMNITVPQIVEKALAWCGHRRFEFTGWYSSKEYDQGIIWARDVDAAKIVLERTYFHVQLRETKREAFDANDQFVY